MLKLPFKTSPKEFELAIIGNDIIGILELPKYGDISPNERLFIKAANLTDIRIAAVKLAKDIAVKSGNKVIDIYNALTQGDSESLAEYLEEFVTFQDLLEENSSARSLVLATAVIQRLVPDWKLENTGDPNQIHPQLLNLVIEFAKNEEAGWPIEATPITEEDLGNSTPTPEIPTGQKSTGDAEDTGRRKKDLVKEGLVVSQPG
ncbi:hypothetical protein FD723_18650 [Nostoc sp. C052]|uniref:hypothetical protein n=1 Tax=Nostoc sp. C052 TaxID=2576902 RepID=UPI0015C2D992|nr:hypothetical protein [Nostoc sp. C052]QLE42240.1 hypothetical protein FD723_18650 [Nostoc sp. C052]